MTQTTSAYFNRTGRRTYKSNEQDKLTGMLLLGSFIAASNNVYETPRF